MEQTCPWSESWSFNSASANLSSSMSSGLSGHARLHCMGAMSFPFDEALASVGTTLNTPSAHPLGSTFNSIPTISASMPSFGTLQQVAETHRMPDGTPLGASSFPGATESNPRTSSSWCRPYLNGTQAADVSKKHKIGEKSEGMPTAAPSGLGIVCQSDVINLQDGQGALMPFYGTQSVAHSRGVGAVAAGTARPRVRARRGQATDPHSIAERLRRERIAERMKALQELVPNSNKTDKASMLDEIVEYVKFLQLQVKVLSMSRLGAAGAVTPYLNNLPLEDGMVAAEQQVAQLMEEDMGSAMQFLQAKGLCLMPVSLASFLSSPRPEGNDMQALGGAPGLMAIVDHPQLVTSSCSFTSFAGVASSAGAGDTTTFSE